MNAKRSHLYCAPGSVYAHLDCVGSGLRGVCNVISSLPLELLERDGACSLLLLLHGSWDLGDQTVLDNMIVDELDKACLVPIPAGIVCYM